MSESPAPISALQPQVPAKLAALIDAMLAKDPSARPASMAEVGRQLGEL